MLTRSQIINDLRYDDDILKLERKVKYLKEGDEGSYNSHCPNNYFRRDSITFEYIKSYGCNFDCKECWDNIILKYMKTDKKNNLNWEE